MRMAGRGVEAMRGGAVSAAGADVRGGAPLPAAFQPTPPLPPPTGVVDDDALDDDVVDGMVAARQAVAGWRAWTSLIALRVLSLARRQATVLISAALLALTAIITRSSCDGACEVAGAQAADWIALAAFATVITVPGRVFDHVFFGIVSGVAQVVTLPVLYPVYFFVSSLEGALSRFWWIGMLARYWRSFVSTTQPELVQRAVLCLLVFQLLAVARTLALRILLRQVLIDSFEQRINDTLFQSAVWLSVSQPYRLSREGKVVTRRDAEFTELLRMHKSSDFRTKLDFISKQTFRAYLADGTLVSVPRKELVAPFAKLAFKRLARLPAHALVHIDIQSRDEIREGLYGALPHTLPFGGVYFGADAGAAAAHPPHAGMMDTVGHGTFGYGGHDTVRDAALAAGLARDGGAAPPDSGAQDVQRDALLRQVQVTPGAGGFHVRGAGTGLSVDVTAASPTAPSSRRGSDASTSSRADESSTYTGVVGTRLHRARSRAGSTLQSLMSSARAVLSTHTPGPASASMSNIMSSRSSAMRRATLSPTREVDARGSRLEPAAGRTEAQTQAMVGAPPRSDVGLLSSAPPVIDDSQLVVGIAEPTQRQPAPSAPPMSARLAGSLPAPATKAGTPLRAHTRRLTAHTFIPPPASVSMSRSTSSDTAAAAGNGGSTNASAAGGAPGAPNPLAAHGVATSPVVFPVVFSPGPIVPPPVALSAARTASDARLPDAALATTAMEPSPLGSENSAPRGSGHTPARATSAPKRRAASAFFDELDVAHVLQVSPRVATSSEAAAAGGGADAERASVPLTAVSDTQEVQRAAPLSDVDVGNHAQPQGMRSASASPVRRQLTRAASISSSTSPRGWVEPGQIRRLESLRRPSDSNLMQLAAEAKAEEAALEAGRAPPVGQPEAAAQPTTREAKPDGARHISGRGGTSGGLPHDGLRLGSGGGSGDGSGGSGSWRFHMLRRRFAPRSHGALADGDDHGGASLPLPAHAAPGRTRSDDLLRGVGVASISRAARSSLSGILPHVTPSPSPSPRTSASAGTKGDGISPLTVGSGVVRSPTGGGGGGSADGSASAQDGGAGAFGAAAAAAAGGSAVGSTSTLGRQMGKYVTEALRAVLAPEHFETAPGEARDEPQPTSVTDVSAGGGATTTGKAAAPDKKEYPKLGIGHIAACLEVEALDPERAFALFDTNGDNEIERAEFISAVENIWTNIRSLKASLSGQQSVSTAINWLLDLVFWACTMSVCLWIFDVPVVQVFVPLGTVLVSASFAIGSSLSNIVSSLIFVLITRPYNVGDRITASGVLNGDELLIVKRIDVLNTLFVRLVNKDILVPNHQLLQQNIENFKRSPPAVQRIELHVSYQTTAAQLEALRLRLNAYLETQPLSWKPTCMIRMSAIQQQTLVLTIWVSSHYLWQDTPQLSRATFALYMHLLAAMREISIQFRAPEQTVRLESLANAAAPAFISPAAATAGLAHSAHPFRSLGASSGRVTPQDGTHTGWAAPAGSLGAVGGGSFYAPPAAVYPHPPSSLRTSHSVSGGMHHAYAPSYASSSAAALGVNGHSAPAYSGAASAHPPLHIQAGSTAGAGLDAHAHGVLSRGHGSAGGLRLPARDAEATSGHYQGRGGGQVHVAGGVEAGMAVHGSGGSELGLDLMAPDFAAASHPTALPLVPSHYALTPGGSGGLAAAASGTAPSLLYRPVASYVPPLATANTSPLASAPALRPSSGV